MSQTCNKFTVLQYRLLLKLLFKGKFVHEIISVFNLSLHLYAKMNPQVSIYDLADFHV